MHHVRFSVHALGHDNPNLPLPPCCCDPWLVVDEPRLLSCRYNFNHGAGLCCLNHGLVRSMGRAAARTPLRVWHLAFALTTPSAAHSLFASLCCLFPYALPPLRRRALGPVRPGLPLRPRVPRGLVQVRRKTRAPLPCAPLSSRALPPRRNQPRHHPPRRQASLTA